ncbi:hypothetical protein IM660_02885 [Ruania alkalisoli]|uniref:Uncharacterized protein n=1 Tax=Ruania alkalisoli TaxID=2779775 RepID=A0A7M1SW26_9MICO|nr:hypothetical protein [Ruania alkalisoli]QOR71267.1 hypothetical protein IM660_02885 [Ruania alkalisoli]
MPSTEEHTMNTHDDLFRAEMADRRERLLTQLVVPRTRRRLNIRRLIAQRAAAQTVRAQPSLAHQDLERRA